MSVINKALVQRRFQKALATYDEQAVVQQRIHRQLLFLLCSQPITEFDLVLEVGCGTGYFTELIDQHFAVRHWELNDLCDVSVNLAARLSRRCYRFYCADAEKLILSQQYDLILSASALQWFTEPQAFVRKCVAHLKQRGLILFSSFASHNLQEIADLTGKHLIYPSIEQWQKWLENDFEVLHLSQGIDVMYFPDGFAVLKHLKATGVTGIQSQRWTKQTVEQFCWRYESKYKRIKGITLTYRPLFILARKK